MAVIVLVIVGAVRAPAPRQACASSEDNAHSRHSQFQHSSNLTAVFGACVGCAFLCDSSLRLGVAAYVHNWNWAAMLAVGVPLMVMDGALASANVARYFTAGPVLLGEGSANGRSAWIAYIPLILIVTGSTFMATWMARARRRARSAHGARTARDARATAARSGGAGTSCWRRRGARTRCWLWGTAWSCTRRGCWTPRCCSCSRPRSRSRCRT